MSHCFYLQKGGVVKHQPSVVFYLPFSLGVCSVEDSVDLTYLAQGKSSTVRCVTPCLSTFLVLNYHSNKSFDYIALEPICASDGTDNIF